MKAIHFWTKAMREAPLEGTPGGVPANPAPDAAPAGGAPVAPAAPDLSWAPAEFLDNGAFKADAFKTHYETLASEKAARDAAAAAIPEAYEFALPADLNLGLPEGMDYKLDPSDPTYAPLFGELGTFLKEVGAPAEAAGKVTGLLARYEAAKINALVAERTKEIEAIGATEAARTARIQTVERALEGRLPEAQAKALKGVVYTKDALMAIETLLSTGGVSTPPSTPQTAEPNPLAARYPTMAAR